MGGAPYFQWRKTHKGKKCEVSCSDLHVVEDDWTEERSLRAANDWWRHTLETLGVTAAQAPHAAARRKAEYARAHGLEDEAKQWEYEAEGLKDIRRAAQMQPLADPHDVEAVNRKLAIILECGEEFSKALSAFLLQHDLSQKQLNTVFGYGEVWVDRLKREPAVPLDKKIGHWADKWAESLREEAAGRTEQGRGEEPRHHVGALRGVHRAGDGGGHDHRRPMGGLGAAVVEVASGAGRGRDRQTG